MASKNTEPTLSDIEKQIADLSAQKAEMERKAAVDLIPLYQEIVDLITDEGLIALVAKSKDQQVRLPDNSMAKQQIGHLATVVNGITMFFNAELTRLEAMAVAPERVVEVAPGDVKPTT